MGDRFINNLNEEAERIIKSFIKTLKKLLPEKKSIIEKGLKFSINMQHNDWSFFENYRSYIPMDISAILHIAKDDHRALVHAIKELAEEIDVEDFYYG